MSLLLEPFTLRQLTLPNRIAVSPMCQYSSTDGLANDWHLVHLGSRKEQGADLIDVSTRGNHPAQQIPLGLGYQVNHARQFAVRQRSQLLRLG